MEALVPKGGVYIIYSHTKSQGSQWPERAFSHLQVGVDRCRLARRNIKAWTQVDLVSTLWVEPEITVDNPKGHD